MSKYIIGIDQSTQGTKALLVDEGGHLIHRADRSHRQIVNEAGWVSHDPAEIAANVLAVATGIPEHDSYAKAFIDATRWIKRNLPHAKVSGGVSNLSFAFRGNMTSGFAMRST